MMRIGVDIVNISDIEKLLKTNKGTSKVYSDEEMKLMNGVIYEKRLKHLAGRFAVKEATLKALGTGVSEGIGFKDIETFNEENGRPILILHNAASKIALELGINEYNVSISYAKDYAIAMVVLI